MMAVENFQFADMQNFEAFDRRNQILLNTNSAYLFSHKGNIRKFTCKRLLVNKILYCTRIIILLLCAYGNFMSLATEERILSSQFRKTGSFLKSILAPLILQLVLTYYFTCQFLNLV